MKLADDLHAAVMRRQAAVKDGRGQSHALYAFVRDETCRGVCDCAQTFEADTPTRFFELFDAHREAVSA